MCLILKQAQNIEGLSPIHLAVKQNDMDALNILRSAYPGQLINIPTSDNETCLHIGINILVKFHL